MNFVDPTGHNACTPEDRAAGACTVADGAPVTDSVSQPLVDEASDSEVATLVSSIMAFAVNVKEGVNTPIGKGWKIRVDAPKKGQPASTQTHVHIIGPNGQKLTIKQDGSISHEGQTKGKVPKDVIKEAKDALDAYTNKSVSVTSGGTWVSEAVGAATATAIGIGLLYMATQGAGGSGGDVLAQ